MTLLEQEKDFLRRLFGELLMNLVLMTLIKVKLEIAISSPLVPLQLNGVPEQNLSFLHKIIIKLES